MKRFTKMLALGMTLAMVFGMSVSASNNSTTNPSVKPYAPGNVGAVDEDGNAFSGNQVATGIYKGVTTEEAYNNAVAATESADTKAELAAVVPGWKIDWVVDVWNLQVDYDEVKELTTVKVKMPALPDRENYTYVILHYPTADWSNIGGYPQVVKMTPVDWENNYWTFKVDSGSPVVFVRLAKVSEDTTTDNGTTTAPEAQAPATTPVGGVVSPKTGEAMPVATVMVLVCLAGVAVCAKKVRSNG